MPGVDHLEHTHAPKQTLGWLLFPSPWLQLRVLAIQQGTRMRIITWQVQEAKSIFKGRWFIDGFIEEQFLSFSPNGRVVARGRLQVKKEFMTKEGGGLSLGQTSQRQLFKERARQRHFLFSLTAVRPSPIWTLEAMPLLFPGTYDHRHFLHERVMDLRLITAKQVPFRK